MSADAMLTELVTELGTADRPMPSRDDLTARLGAILTTMRVETNPITASRSIGEVYHAMRRMRAGGIRSSGDLGRALNPSLNTEMAASLGLRRLNVMLRYSWVRHPAFGQWELTAEGLAALADWEAGQ